MVTFKYDSRTAELSIIPRDLEGLQPLILPGCHRVDMLLRACLSELLNTKNMQPGIVNATLSMLAAGK